MFIENHLRKEQTRHQMLRVSLFAFRRKGKKFCANIFVLFPQSQISVKTMVPFIVFASTQSKMGQALLVKHPHSVGYTPAVTK